MNKFFLKIHHSKYFQSVYQYSPVIKKLVDTIHGIFIGRGDLMVNKVYWILFKITHYSRPGCILSNKSYIKQLAIPNEKNVISINPNRIEFMLVPATQKFQLNNPIENGNWDLKKRKFENIGYELEKRDSSEEIRVSIDRNGKFLLEDGKQRLGREKESGSESVLVFVTKRHYQWAKLKKEIYLYSQEQPKGVYQVPIHPDLKQINAHRGDDRWELIKKNIPISRGTVLDIGSNWGYFCHKFEDLGFDCHAVEINYRWLYFLKKLKEAEDREFKVIQGSVFQISRKEYDIVLALSIFHHFLRSSVLYAKLTRFLGELDTKYMYFEPHETGHGFPGAYVDYSETEFIDYILQNSRLKSYKLLGKTDRGRNLYLLSSS